MWKILSISRFKFYLIQIIDNVEDIIIFQGLSFIYLRYLIMWKILSFPRFKFYLIKIVDNVEDIIVFLGLKVLFN